MRVRAADVSIIEAIKHAESEHAVFLLLTAYIESLWLSEDGIGLGAALRRLPIDGHLDVLERAQALSLEERTAEAPIVAEAAEIFRVASQRLNAGASHADRGSVDAGIGNIPRV
jgi:hypothetical protein